MGQRRHFAGEVGECREHGLDDGEIHEHMPTCTSSDCVGGCIWDEDSDTLNAVGTASG